VWVVHLKFIGFLFVGACFQLPVVCDLVVQMKNRLGLHKAERDLSKTLLFIRVKKMTMNNNFSSLSIVNCQLSTVKVHCQLSTVNFVAYELVGIVSFKIIIVTHKQQPCS